MQTGRIENIEGILYFIHEVYCEFFSNKSFYLQNKVNVIQEFKDKLSVFALEEKKKKLKKINLLIDNKLHYIECKRNIIISKIKVVNQKICKIYLSQQDIEEKYFKYKNEEMEQMKHNLAFIKAILLELKSLLIEINAKAEALVLLKHKFWSSYLNEESIKNLSLFTTNYLEFYNKVDNISKYV